MLSLRHVLAVLPSVALLLAAEHRAAACGGCFHPPKETPTVVTDHRMIFAVSPKQTTLYDQMRYTGAPSSFAWVLPIAGQVKIGLSSDELFNALDSQTSVEVIGPEANCWVPPSCVQALPPSVAAGARGGGGGGGGGVTVFAHEVVGPYETVQLRATDPKALATWLSAHHYEIPPDAQAIVDGYVKEQSSFLAMKLVPGATVQAMRPVRVTSPGASITLPLRMVAAGAGATLGVTLWVVSDGRYEPQNFPFFTIGAADVVWDWTTSSSNYTTVRASKTKAADDAGWQIESSLDVSTQSITSQLANTTPQVPRTPAMRVDAGRVGAARDGSAPEKTDEEQRAEDLEVLFGGASTPAPSVRVTRLRADLAHAALGRDLRLQASSDQAVLSNVVQVTREASPPMCAVYDDKCSIIGNAPRPEAEAKNKALVSPHLANGVSEKKRFGCGASSGSPPLSASAALISLAFAGVAFARRRRRAPRV
jgi:MYXO-CTERM domain-containing protein